MPEFKSKLLGFKLDKARWSKEFERDIVRLVRNATRAWLRAIITQVPVWSGMARGSIKFAKGPNGNLAQFLRVAIPIDPVGPIGMSFKSPYSGKRVFIPDSKTPEAGGEMASYKFVNANHTYSFQFKSKVPHYMYNEFFERVDYGAANQQIEAPWLSLEKARGAFLSYLRQEIKARRFARVKKFIVRTDTSETLPDDIKVGSAARLTYKDNRDE